MKLQVLVDGVEVGATDLGGPGIIPYGQAAMGLSAIVATIYAKANPESDDALFISGANFSLRSRTAARRRRARA